jgi:hypothetical protein
MRVPRGVGTCRHAYGVGLRRRLAKNSVRSPAHHKRVCLADC